MFQDVNTGNNMAPFAFMYKRYLIARSGSRYIVHAIGSPKVLGYFNDPSQARIFIDQLRPNLPDGMGALDEFNINWAIGIAAIAAFFLFNKTPRQSDYARR